MDEMEEIGPLMAIMVMALMMSMFTPQAEAVEPASLSGSVTDIDSNPIAGIQVAIASEDVSCTTGASGYYEFDDLQPNMVVYLSVVNAEAMGYNPIPLIEVHLVSGPNTMDIVLTSSTTPPDPEEPPEDGWTEEVSIREVEVTPSVAYVGEIVNIDVRIDYPLSMPLPVDIACEVAVDGTVLNGAFTISAYSAKLRFQYTTTSVGTFTATAGDKSATFTVLQSIAGTYYMPWGGIRMPVCTEIIVPNVEPFTYGGVIHPGGNYVMRGTGTFRTRIRQVIDKMPNAYPTVWDPAGATVNNWVTYVDYGYSTSVVVMAVTFTCQEYWNSKEALANLLNRATDGMYVRVPDEWISLYGSTCPSCGGTGVTTQRERTGRCPECGGTGVSLRADLKNGWRDWEKFIRYFSICGAGSCIPRIYCPYCDMRIDGSPHTENSHPNHKLTEPAWF